MSTRYSQIFTLRDIFNDQRLASKLPLINYKEEQKNDGKMSYRTYGQTITTQVFNTSKATARPYYGKFRAKRSGDYIEIDGTLQTSLTAVYNAVLMALKANSQMFSFTANNMDIIRSALKEAEKNKRTYGFSSKLNLRVQSKSEMLGMTRKQLLGMMNNIMEDIFFSGNYPKTLKKYGIVEQINSLGGLTFEQRQRNWQIRVGE